MFARRPEGLFFNRPRGGFHVPAERRVHYEQIGLAARFAEIHRGPPLPLAPVGHALSRPSLAGRPEHAAWDPPGGTGGSRHGRPGRGEGSLARICALTCRDIRLKFSAMAFSADSGSLYTAGLDKSIHLWQLPDRVLPAGDALNKALLVEHVGGNEKTIRWDIARGQRGSIYAMALSLADRRAGDRRLRRPGHPRRHRPVGPDARAGYGRAAGAGRAPADDPLVGLFGVGSVVGLDRPRRARFVMASGRGRRAALCPSDSEQYGPEAARTIAASLRWRPIAVAADRWVALPWYAGPDQAGKLVGRCVCSTSARAGRVARWGDLSREHHRDDLLAGRKVAGCR